MGLECLILTADPSVLAEVRAGLAEYKTALQFRQDAASAIELASRRHLDGLVVDCDDVPGGADSLIQLRKTAANKQTLILALVNGKTSEQQALSLGADFAFSKPIQQSRLESVLEIAIPKMEREHRRYFRFEVNLPVQFSDAKGRSFAARITNLSEGGLAMRLNDPVRLTGVMILDFNLPSIRPQPFHGKAEVIWTDAFVMGLRFLYIEKESEIAFQNWLTSLEAQARFHESVQ
jgi:DNA-binding NarL/FixJ family response regulator